ncbi:MAG: hypothetical protein WCJ70_05175 [bacterium]
MTTSTIMHQIKSHERRAILARLLTEAAIFTVAIVTSLLTAQSVYTLLTEQGRFEFLELIADDAEMLREFGPSELMDIVRDISPGELATILIGVLVGIYIGYHVIRSLPLLRRKIRSLQRI